MHVTNAAHTGNAFLHGVPGFEKKRTYKPGPIFRADTFF